MHWVKSWLRHFLHPNLPLHGYGTCQVSTRFLNHLSDEELTWLNEALSWNCFTVDQKGRRFGSAAWLGKRSSPQEIPDHRILLMDKYFQLSDKHVLEIGCFEGVHTAGLSMYAKHVTAVDARLENVVKTIVRSAMFGYAPTVFKWNVEEELPPQECLVADVAHHVGVLYHLKDPVTHLQRLGRYVRVGIMLDTHYCLDEEACESYSVDGKQYLHKRYREGGRRDVFSGMYDHAKWLRLKDIEEILNGAGFDQVDIIEKQNQRNGPRVLLVARRVPG